MPMNIGFNIKIEYVNYRADFDLSLLRCADPDHLRAALPPPPNPAQVLPNPIEPQRDAAPAAPLRHRQSEYEQLRAFASVRVCVIAAETCSRSMQSSLRT